MPTKNFQTWSSSDQSTQTFRNVKIKISQARTRRWILQGAFFQNHYKTLGSTQNQKPWKSLSTIWCCRIQRTRFGKKSRFTLSTLPKGVSKTNWGGLAGILEIVTFLAQQWREREISKVVLFLSPCEKRKQENRLYLELWISQVSQKFVVDYLDKIMHENIHSYLLLL